MPNHVLAFRTKAIESELAESANVGAAKETGFRLESLRSVLIQSVVSTLRVLCSTYSQKSGPPLCIPLLKSVELTSACTVAYQVGLKVIFASMPPTRLDATMQRLSVQAVLGTVASSRSV